MKIGRRIIRKQINQYKPRIRTYMFRILINLFHNRYKIKSVIVCIQLGTLSYAWNGKICHGWHQTCQDFSLYKEHVCKTGCISAPPQSVHRMYKTNYSLQIR